MKVSEAIKKYNLTRQQKDCFGHIYTHNVYMREEERNGIKYIWTVEQDELAQEEGEILYFLIIERFDFNKIIINKYGHERPSKRTKILKLEND